MAQNLVRGCVPRVSGGRTGEGDGDPVVALFTHLSRVPETYVDEAPYAVRVAGASVVEHLTGAGIVINPGHAIGFEIGSDGVEAIRRDFGPDAGGAGAGADPAS